MKILADREQLLDSITRIASVVPSRSPKPILSNVLIHATEHGTQVMASDLEATVRLSCLGVKIDAPGSAVLPMPKIVQILRSCSGDDELAIEVDAGLLHIRGHRSAFKLASEDPTLFPEPPRHPGGGHALNADNLSLAIRRTSFSCDFDSTRYALAGVLFDFSQDGDTRTISCVGTDGRRMARQDIEYEYGGHADPPSISPVIPVKALKLIDRNLDYDEPVLLHVDPGKSIAVKTGRAEIWSRLVEGRFPNYSAVIPGSHNHRVTFSRAGDLLSAVEQAAIVTSKESRGVDFHFGDGLLKLASQTADIGESHVELPVDGDAELVVTMDASYAAEMLRVLDPNEPVTVEMTDGKKAVVFRTADYLYVLMPLNRDR